MDFFTSLSFFWIYKKILKLFGFGNGFFGGVCFFRIIIGYFRILQSETYDVLDCIFYDKAITGEKNTKCYNNTQFTETTQSDGTLLECKSDSVWGQYFFNQTNNTSKPNNIGTCIEFDLVEVTHINFQLDGNSLYGITLSATGHYKITVSNDYITILKDGIQVDSKTTSTYISDTFLCKFAYRGTTEYVKYTNMEIYPI